MILDWTEDFDRSLTAVEEGSGPVVEITLAPLEELSQLATRRLAVRWLSMTAYALPPYQLVGMSGMTLPTSVRTLRKGSARTRLLDAAVALIRAKGLTATTVDDLCAAAGVTKGAFFHHFDTKERLAVAAADHWSETTGAVFASAAYHAKADPLDRVLGYLDLRATLIRGTPAEFSCLAGTMTQEAFELSPPIRNACAASIFGHAATLEADLTAAIAAHPPAVKVNAASLARHTQAVLQGAFILAKAADDPALVLDNIEHLRRYLQLLFSPPVQPPVPTRKKRT